MKKCIVLALAVMFAGGCESWNKIWGKYNRTNDQAKADAAKRWYKARARVICGVGQEHLKVGQLDPAASRAQEALALDSEHVAARMLLGKVYIEQGHYNLAFKELEQAREKLPKSPEVFYLLGVAQEKAGRLEEALVSYRRAHALDGSDLSAVMAAAEVLTAMGRVREAQLYIDSYLSVGGDLPGMFELAGRFAMMRGEHSKAVRFFEQAHDLDHRNLFYRESLAKAQFFASLHAEAAETLESLEKTDSYRDRAWVHSMLGDCYMVLGRFRKACDAYHAATELTPSESGVWVNFARSAMAMNDCSRAILAARQALDLDRDSLDALLVLSYALVRNGQASRAVSALTQGLARHPESVMLRCLLGRAYSAGGNEAEATRCYVAALRVEPDNRFARELLEAQGKERVSRVGASAPGGDG